MYATHSVTETGTAPAAATPHVTHVMATLPSLYPIYVPVHGAIAAVRLGAAANIVLSTPAYSGGCQLSLLCCAVLCCAVLCCAVLHVLAQM